MEENNHFRKPTFGRKPYRVDAKALESKGFELIRYDRHESYAKTYALEGRLFVGSVNPVTGDRTISKVGPFASVKDADLLRQAWDALSEDVLGPRPEKAEPESYGAVLHAPEAPKAEEMKTSLFDASRYIYEDLTLGNGAVVTPKIVTREEAAEMAKAAQNAPGATTTWNTVIGANKDDTSIWSAAGAHLAQEGAKEDAEEKGK